MQQAKHCSGDIPCTPYVYRAPSPPHTRTRSLTCRGISGCGSSEAAPRCGGSGKAPEPAAPGSEARGGCRGGETAKAPAPSGSEASRRRLGATRAARQCGERVGGGVESKARGGGACDILRLLREKTQRGGGEGQGGSECGALRLLTRCNTTTSILARPCMVRVALAGAAEVGESRGFRFQCDAGKRVQWQCMVHGAWHAVGVITFASSASGAGGCCCGCGVLAACTCWHTHAHTCTNEGGIQI